MLDLCLTLQFDNNKKVYLSSIDISSLEERQSEGIKYRQICMTSGRVYAVTESTGKLLELINPQQESRE